MNSDLQQDLQNLRCEGNIAFLPTDKLNDYAGLKKTLTQATGKYKKNSFVFPNPAKPIIDSLITGKVINFKKDFQFFATPSGLAERMANEIVWNKPEVEILEPSAGHGALIDAVLALNKSVKKNVDAVELADLNFFILEDIYRRRENINLIKGDFLTFEPVKKYDVIIANPPFSKNQDIDHIRKMYDLLADNGQLVTIASTSWTFGNQKKQVAFKDWLENDVAANWIDLQSGSFKSSGTNVSGVLITINK